MKAIVEVKARSGTGYYASVVTEEDNLVSSLRWTYQTPLCESKFTALDKAEEWAEKNGFELVQYFE